MPPNPPIEHIPQNEHEYDLTGLIVDYENAPDPTAYDQGSYSDQMEKFKNQEYPPDGPEIRAEIRHGPVEIQ